MATALRQIVIADVSMSLDNVLAVAGAAVGNTPMLIVGLVISILLMGVAATLISKLLERYRWIAYVGVALIVWIGLKMVYEDGHRLLTLYGPGHAALQQRPALVVAAAPRRPGRDPALTRAADDRSTRHAQGLAVRAAACGDARGLRTRARPTVAAQGAARGRTCRSRNWRGACPPRRLIHPGGDHESAPG